MRHDLVLRPNLNEELFTVNDFFVWCSWEKEPHKRQFLQCRMNQTVCIDSIFTGCMHLLNTFCTLQDLFLVWLQESWWGSENDVLVAAIKPLQEGKVLYRSRAFTSHHAMNLEEKRRTFESVSMKETKISLTWNVLWKRLWTTLQQIIRSQLDVLTLKVWTIFWRKFQGKFFWM